MGGVHLEKVVEIAWIRVSEGDYYVEVTADVTGDALVGT